MMQRSPQAQAGVDARGKPLQGLRVGKVTELNMFYTVTPGHEEAIRKAITDFHTSPLRDPVKGEDANVRIGLHELRHLLFDNDTRLLWMTSFDTEWDPYIDDTIVAAGEPGALLVFGRPAQSTEEVLTAGAAIYGSMLQHTTQAPQGIGQGNIPNHAASIKDLFNSTRVDAAGELITQPDITMIEHRKNRRLRQAFDTALNNPGAAQALQHPALNVLADIAAEPQPPAAQGQDATPGDALRSGNATELTLFFTVKPGHEQQIRQAIYDYIGKSAHIADEAQAAEIGLHEMRFVLFDDDTRLMLRTTYDTDWDTHVDGIASAGIGALGAILAHTGEAPPGIAEGEALTTSDAVKDFFTSVRTPATGLSITLAEQTIADRVKNRRIRAAFDDVLEHPDAAEALQHPALAPLLELAAE